MRVDFHPLLTHPPPSYMVSPTPLSDRLLIFIASQTKAMVNAFCIGKPSTRENIGELCARYVCAMHYICEYQ